MTELFVDASAFISWLNPEDKNHSAAIQFEKQAEGYQWITSNLVISEVCTVLAMRVSQPLAHEFARRLHSSESPVQIVYVDQPVHEAAIVIFTNATSKNLSFTDCTSFALMKQRDIKHAFTVDQHLRQRGVTVLPGQPQLIHSSFPRRRESSTT